MNVEIKHGAVGSSDIISQTTSHKQNVYIYFLFQSVTQQAVREFQASCVCIRCLPIQIKIRIGCNWRHDGHGAVLADEEDTPILSEPYIILFCFLFLRQLHNVPSLHIL